ncbi:hypothetical protein SEA_KINGBOB_53 [Arthrobacter phage KingBob]|uniref:Uncharacterized protein n=1 Tax=Arthrobacter phage Sergei TaxID=2250416 RepID=A0A345KPZ1_9CAUD|nr:hypothetical protein KDJ06_gp53 [Arthrobacter phage Sergei]AXH43980.1 hypothetical protein SEA_DAIBOJU_53 [Arthrobacter phage Daiboju]AXH44042.1 hypothetical protein SEA_HERB_53 [Arthrobacter phage Herb]AXH44286.1 hypothetical protein SEA_KINGBOB_53 [Arthrobacter phage KingBob]QGJ97193.1 hypothetical protein SEA_MARIA1952_52 [Arthrobacter phage Maria1952]AXH45093.1 hypothetical protein SEA_SERGEI_53 [Arthrobacter phage Sergei]
MAKGLSNTKKAEINILVGIGNGHYSFFDEGIVEGSGIWYDALRDETTGISSNLAARAITLMVKDGYVTKERDDEEYWVALTELGAKAALAMKDEGVLAITEEAVEPKERKAPTAQVAQGGQCKCGCGTQVNGKKATYRPGHDAKHVSRLVMETKTTGKQPKETSQLSTRLFAKYIKAVSK